MLALIASPIARYAAVAALVIGIVWYAYSEGKHSGTSSVRNEIMIENAKRIDDAIRADDDARKCAADPACRLRPDANQRD